MAYLTLLALVPVVTISFVVLNALPFFSGLRSALQRFMTSQMLLPGIADTVTRYLNQFVAKATELSFISTLVFFASALLAMLTIDRTLNRIWNSKRLRPIGQRLLVYCGLLTVAPLGLAALLAMNAVVFNDWLIAAVQTLGAERRSVAGVRSAWFSILPGVIAAGLLILTYRWVPNAAVRWVHAVAGAAIAVVLLAALRAGLVWSLAALPTYTVVYGAFAALPVLLVWLYLFWLAVLIGALVAAGLR